MGRRTTNKESPLTAQPHPIPTQRTAHLILRPFDLDDVDRLHHVMNDREVMRYFPNPDPPARDQIERLIRFQLKHWEQYGYGWWAVCRADLAAETALIGWAGLQYLPDTDEVEVGYLLGNGHWGRGLATEAARASVRFGFAQLGIETIVGVVHPENIASQRVLEKAGLSYVERANYFGMDVYRYQITQAGWSEVRGPRAF
jgi:ribosomal-protein-alanine N-acetyltransferase